MLIPRKYREAAKAFLFFMLGFYILVVTHELTHGFIADQFCQQIRYNWIPTTEYLANTQYTGCTETERLMDLQYAVEIVGYQLMGFYTAAASFYILVSQKVKF